MHDFRYVRGQLFCEGVSVDSLVQKFGSPLYIYSQRTLTNHFQKLDQALAPLDHLVCFAMKSNSNLAVLRVNPNVDAHTHAKITTGTYENKFGIAIEEVEGVYARASKLKNLHLRGLQMHIGSQLTQVDPFEQAVTKVIPLVQKLAPKYGF